MKQQPTTREAADTKHLTQSLLDQVELHGPGTLNFFVIFGQAQLQYDGRWPASISWKNLSEKRYYSCKKNQSNLAKMYATTYSYSYILFHIYVEFAFALSWLNKSRKHGPRFSANAATWTSATSLHSRKQTAYFCWIFLAYLMMISS